MKSTKLSHMFMKAVIIVVISLMAFSLHGWGGSRVAAAAAPYFFVRANTDQVYCRDWTLGVTVTLTIDDPAIPGSSDYTATKIIGVHPTIPGATFAQFDLEGVFNIKDGFVVSMSDGVTTKSHTVTGLEITDYDLAVDTVQGGAAAGSQVMAWACDSSTCSYRHVTANGLGVWTADFAHKGTADDEQTTLNIMPGNWLDSRQCDGDGDCTEFGTRIPLTRIVVRANEDQVFARDWTLGHTVTLTIDNPGTPAAPDYTSTRVVVVYPDDPSSTYAQFDLKGVFDIQPGFVVRVTDGTDTKIYYVTGLEITGYDLALDTVVGVATANSHIDVSACDSSTCFNRHVITNDLGSWGYWTADFGHVGTAADEQNTFNIVPGTWIDSKECNGDGDCTNYGITTTSTTLFRIFLPLVIR